MGYIEIKSYNIDKLYCVWSASFFNSYHITYVVWVIGVNLLMSMILIWSVKKFNMTYVMTSNPNLKINHNNNLELQKLINAYQLSEEKIKTSTEEFKFQAETLMRDMISKLIEQ